MNQFLKIKQDKTSTFYKKPKSLNQKIMKKSSKTQHRETNLKNKREFKNMKDRQQYTTIRVPKEVNGQNCREDLRITADNFTEMKIGKHIQFKLHCEY